MDQISINEINDALQKGEGVLVFVSSRVAAKQVFDQLGGVGNTHVESVHIFNGTFTVSTVNDGELVIIPWFRSHKHQLDLAKEANIVAVESDHLFSPEQNIAAEKLLSDLGVKFCKLQ